MPESPSGGTSRCLITGAKGFIGSWIVKSLVERGSDPVLFDLDAETHRLSALLSDEQIARLTCVRGDITNLEALDRAAAEHGVTHFIHLAALQVPACAANPPLGARVNVLGTLNVFEVARARPEQVKRVVYASSAAVFGPEEFYGSKTVIEGAPVHPGTHYGVFKVCNEDSARVYYLNHGISSAALRPWAVYGVGRDQGITSGPTKAIKAAVVGHPYTIRFTGGLDLQYVDDTAKIFLRCAESDLPGAHVYTLRGTVVEMEEFLETLAGLFPQARELVRAAGPPLPIAHDLDDSALVRDLGEVPRTPLEQGIRETAEIFQRLRAAGRLDLKDLEI